MEKIKTPFNRIKLLFQSLAGRFDVELDDEEGFDKEELEKLNKMTEKNIQELVKTHGIQTMTITENKEGKDRLGIKKPTITTRSRKVKQEQEIEQDKEIEL